MTIIVSMIESIRKAASYNRHELAAPRVILWPDEERLWIEVIDLLRTSCPACGRSETMIQTKRQAPRPGCDTNWRTKAKRMCR